MLSKSFACGEQAIRKISLAKLGSPSLACELHTKDSTSNSFNL